MCFSERDYQGHQTREPVTFLMSTPDRRNELAALFYRIKFNTEIDRSYERKVFESKGAGRDTLVELARERDNLKAIAAAYAKQLAELRIDKEAVLYSEALGSFSTGKVDEALRKLNDAILEKAVADARKNRDAAQKALDDAVQAYLLKGGILTTQFKIGDARRAYRKACSADPNSFDAQLALARFYCSVEPDPGNARSHYERCLQIARCDNNSLRVAVIQVDIGNLSMEELKYDEARGAYEDALRVLRILAARDPATHELDLVAVLADLGILAHTEHRNLGARSLYQEALLICLRSDRPRQAQSDVVAAAREDKALAFFDLAMLNQDERYYEGARTGYEAALSIWVPFARRGSIRHWEYAGEAYDRLGVVATEERRWQLAHSEFGMALEIRRELDRHNPELYDAKLASTLNHIGILARKEQRNDVARKALTEAVGIYRRRNSPDELPDLAEALKNLGSVDSNSEARASLQEALVILRNLAKEHPTVYPPALADALKEAGSQSRKEGRRKEARKAFDEALTIYRKFAKTAPAQFDPDVLEIQRQLQALEH
jgi:hypothetical protein